MEQPQVIGYIRVSTDEQVDSGAGLAAQRATLKAEATRRGWDLEIVVEEGRSAKDLDRPALASALVRLDKRQATALVVSKLDRLSRSVTDFGGLLDRAKRRGWSVVCLDLGVDTTTPVGEFTANVVVSAAQYERRLIGQRTKDALAARKAAGVRLGRPSALPAEVVARIVAERAAGASLPAIARKLQADAIPTAQGGAQWYPATVSKVLKGQDAAALAG
ncbi:MAG: recombinase family protein [Quadrisphaera sp.]